jgi:putative two-component system response regulator
MLSAEFRDQTTGNHISRIGCFARHLAKLCGLSDRSANLIFHASKLHDIGKIGIPDEVLLKPGALNENEMKIMKEHTTKGAKILSGSKSEILSYAEKIALNHHERWDGQGYPNGIRGEEIDIYSRITSICDVYDALHSSRPYKEIWENKAIIDELNRLAGSALDPVLTKIFIDHIDDFYQIQSEVEGCS